MTKEKAIEYLKSADVTVGREIKTKTAEALEMAINALEKESILDKIREEIERMDYLDIEDGSDGYDKYVDQYDVLQIIDKYKVESDGKE